jgi:hypothetical protein
MRDHFIGSKPPNYEDLATLEKNKPSLQQAQYYTNSLAGGAETGWRNYQDYYYWLQAQVDIQNRQRIECSSLAAGDQRKHDHYFHLRSR